VLTPDLYDPALNPLYRDVLATTASSRCRAAWAIRSQKGKVEAGVGHAQKTPLKGLRFETLEAAQAVLGSLGDTLGRYGIHGTTKRQVAVMFCRGTAGARAAPRRTVSLLPLRRSHGASHGCVEVEGAY